MAIKFEGGGGKALVAGPQKNTVFFRGFPKTLRILLKIVNSVILNKENQCSMPYLIFLNTV